MRSLYFRILLTCVAFTLLALAANYGISAYYSSRNVRHFHDKVTRYEIAQLRGAFEHGGLDELNEQLAALHTSFDADFRLLDAHYRNLSTGADETPLEVIHRSQRENQTLFEKIMDVPHAVDDKIVFLRPSDDGKYFLAIIVPFHFSLWFFTPYVILISVSVLLTGYVLAMQIARPLRRLESVVERFGRGELNARVGSTRNDEIGKLAQSFDQMAERTETLLTAERRLLQDIAHELRSPLARLNFAIELSRGSNDREASINRLKKEASRLGQLVASLLEVTRAEGDPASTRRESVSLDALLDEIAQDCQLEAAPRGCRIVYDKSCQIAVDGDAELLRRAVENVLRNAIRYSPENSAIGLGLERQRDNAVITVLDAGPGVADEMLTRIFTPFFRADSARSADTGGLGLGLAIAARAVHLHNGGIVAENAHPGLRVIITLPCPAAARA